MWLKNIMNLAKNVLEKTKSQPEIAEEKVETKQPVNNDTPLVRPVLEPAKVTSAYGATEKFRGGKPHGGIDYINTQNNISVVAIGDGKVIEDFDYYIHSKRFKEQRHSAGNMVIIKHRINGRDYFVRYLHLVKNYVKLNQNVKIGEVIGVYGDVGYSFGAHVHIDMFDGAWNKIDPTPILLRGFVASGLVK